MKKFTVSTSGGWNQQNMTLDHVAELVRLLSMDKRPGETIVFNVTAQEGEK